MTNIESIMITCATAILVKLAPERLSKAPIAARRDTATDRLKATLVGDLPSNGARTVRANPVVYRMVAGWDKKLANTIMAKGGNNSATLAMVKDAGKAGVPAAMIAAHKDKLYPAGMKPKAVQSSLHALRTLGIVESVRQ